MNNKEQKEKETVLAENYKGCLCLFRPIICQEGFCCACQIYLDSCRPPEQNKQNGQ